MAQESPKETYVGDGLYASFDGFQIKLRAPREGGDHEVFLEDTTLLEFLRWFTRARGVAVSVAGIELK